MNTKAQKSITLNTGEKIEIGDVFYSSWGYEQTNVSFYQVINVKGKRTLVLREIEAERTETAFLSGTKKPIPNSFINKEAITRRIIESGNSSFIKITICEYAYKLAFSSDDGYESVLYSSYA